MRRAVRSFSFLLFCALFLTICRPLAAAEAKIYYKQSSSDEKKRVALTFDDGPHPRYTPEILDILREYGICATFFVVGTNAEFYPSLVLREVNEGHEIGNHTSNHFHTANLSREELEKDVRSCQETITKITGKAPGLFRPPEGVCTKNVQNIAEKMDLTVVLWSVDTRDWAHTPPCEIVKNIRKNTRDGSIILMHDFIGKNSPTPAALRQVLPLLLESGFEFVTVSSLIGGK